MKKIIRSFSLGILFFIFLIDSKHTIQEAANAVTLCIQSVIPSLIVFIFLSLILSNHISGLCLPGMQQIRKICRMAPGTESILLLGVLGGYPVGAQCIKQAFENKSIDREEAHRLLAFCNNAGPAFILGIGSTLFTNKYLAWLLWLTHIFSAILVGALIPGNQKMNGICKKTEPLCPTAALEKTVKIISCICGWVIIFRVIIGFFQRWCLWLMPSQVQICIKGMLELVNGFHGLFDIPCDGARFIFASAFLGFGGLCVLMQTKGVVGNLGLGMYIPGKCLQTVISVLLATAIEWVVLQPEQRYIPHPFICVCISVIAVIGFISLKKQNNGSIIKANVV